MKFNMSKRTKAFTIVLGFIALLGTFQQVSGYGLTQNTAQTLTNGTTSDLWQSTDTVGYYTIDCSTGDNLLIEYYVIASDGLTLILYDPGGTQVASDYNPNTNMITVSHTCSQNGFYDIQIERDTSGTTNDIRMTISGATPSSGGNIPSYNTFLVLFLSLGVISLLVFKLSKKGKKAGDRVD